MSANFQRAGPLTAANYWDSHQPSSTPSSHRYLTSPSHHTAAAWMRATDGHAYGFTRSRVQYGFPGSLPVEEVPEYQHSPTRATNNPGSKYSKSRSEPQNPYYPTYCPEQKNEELYYRRTTKSAKKHDDARRKVTCSISAQSHPHWPAPGSRLFR